MKERPILFSAPMVQAILAGNKTQTRRAIKWPLMDKTQWFELDASYGIELANPSSPIDHLCPYGQIGDQLWVRETFSASYKTEEHCRKYGEIHYRADCDKFREEMLSLSWTPSIHMPRWASRIQLQITNIRVERLQDISESDALAEGCRRIEGCKWRTWEEADAGIPMHDHTARDAFSGLWRAINGEDSWTENPWVWVIEFKRVERPA